MVIGVTLVSFLALQAGGDPTYLFVSERASQEEIEATRRALGFDRPLHEQYLSFVGDLAQGDFDYDGEVDEDDRTSLINDLTGTIVPQIRMSGSGELAIEFTDGSMLLIADEDKNVFSRFSIRSPNG